MVGVNGDFYADSGRPSGVLMRDNVVESPPYGDRSSTGLTAEGRSTSAGSSSSATWRGPGQRRTLNDLNQAPAPTGSRSSRPPTGPRPWRSRVSPRRDRAVPADSAEYRPQSARSSRSGAGRRHTDPRDGAVLVARGTAAQRLIEECGSGDDRDATDDLPAGPTGITQAVGGGPVLVRSGGPVFRAQEAFTSSQLRPRNPRTGVGQLADGRILMVVTDGRQPATASG